MEICRMAAAASVCLSSLLSRGNPWGCIESVCIFMQITSDPMRSAKLLFDLKVTSGDLSSGSTYLRLLVKHVYSV